MPRRASRGSAESAIDCSQVTSNYAARAFGIKKCDSIKEAKQKAPGIIIKDGSDISDYTDTSNAWRAFASWNK